MLGPSVRIGFWVGGWGLGLGEALGAGVGRERSPLTRGPEGAAHKWRRAARRRTSRILASSHTCCSTPPWNRTCGQCNRSTGPQSICRVGGTRFTSRIQGYRIHAGTGDQQVDCSTEYLRQEACSVDGRAERSGRVAHGGSKLLGGRGCTEERVRGGRGCTAGLWPSFGAAR